MLVAMVLPMMVACGGDDEPSSGGDNGPTPKHIIKIKQYERYINDEYILSYDSQGRVSKVVEKTKNNDGSLGSKTQTTTYQYGEAFIQLDVIYEQKFSDGQLYTGTETYSYTLENGRIVKEVEKHGSSTRTKIFSYDANNNLTSVSNPNTTMLYEWSDGNLTKVDEGYSYSNYWRSYEYTNYQWPKGFIMYLESSYLDACLLAMGYYGNIPKNLPSRNYTTKNGGYCAYDYTFEGSYVAKVVKSDVSPETHQPMSATTMTFVWE